MEYNHVDIEAKWRKHWADNQTYKTVEDPDKPKYYVLDMFPYPSGAGLHVGHPLGYIASDIYARYKRLNGFNVLHPMGYDSFGLPAEQYAIQTGQHPAITTKENIQRYREQLDKIGFSFDWDREVRTSYHMYYRWTQWIFKQLFNSWYSKDSDKADSIERLIRIFETKGNAGVNAVSDSVEVFTADEWKAYSEEEQQKILLNYRLAFLADSWVNWCPALGTVLANDEVKDGVSERGGFPVEQKLMRQWSLRITAYAERLLNGLDTIDWSDALKEQQRNWIGRSTGASVSFDVDGHDEKIEVFTTRPDTIFGVSFMVLAPEHDLVEKITTEDRKEAVDAYVKAAGMKSERDRQSDVKNISGEFTGGYAIHPFTGDKIEIWIGDYVLASYGTGAVMAVPAGDQRDWDFAQHFKIAIPDIFKDVDISEAACAEKEVTLYNSDFLDGMQPEQAIERIIDEIEKRGLGEGKVNYRLRDAVFSRQRYWGEPFPVYYKNEIPYLVDDDKLPVQLPEVDKYLPTEEGEPPLARAKKEAWNVFEGDRMEYNTMPGWAGSSWYFLRYMDARNDEEFASREKTDYWGQVDLYIGGSEHATGHLLYARFWTKFLYDLGLIGFDEPFKKLINQGMILGRSSLVYALLTSIHDQTHRDDTRDMLPAEEIPPVMICASALKKLQKRFDNGLLQKVQDKDELEKIYKDGDTLVDIISSIEDDLTARLMEKYPNRRGRVEVSKTNFYTRHVNIDLVENDLLNMQGFSKWTPEFHDARFVVEGDQFICDSEVEKMSKSKYNVQNPDDLVEKFGADTLRCYEMFLGPLEQAKPWDTQGINGVNNFLRKLWRLFHDADKNFSVSEGDADKAGLKTLHKTIKKVTEDLERYSFNTVVSACMIAVNELTDQKCNNRNVLEGLIIILSPYAPHICEELWEKLGHQESITKANWPAFDASYLEDDSFEYPVSFNGKTRFKMELPTSLSKEEIEKEVLAFEKTQHYLEGKEPKKIIVVPKRIVNVVV